MNILKLTDTFTSGIYKDVKVEEIVDAEGVIFQLIKDGFMFDDEVLKRAHITKTIRDVHYKYEFCDKKESLNDKEDVLPKDTASMKQILREINSLGEKEEPVEEIKPIKEDVGKKIISANDFFEENEGTEV